MYNSRVLYSMKKKWNNHWNVCGQGPKGSWACRGGTPLKRLNIEISKMCFQAFYGKNGPSLLGFSFRNAVFFYTSGVTVGLVACLLILVFILYRLIPMVSSCFVSNNSRLKTNTCMCHSGLKKKKKKKKKGEQGKRKKKRRRKKKGERKRRRKGQGKECYFSSRLGQIWHGSILTPGLV